mmetsp:Transcript_48463/g.157068  ORF Transcript_48463/g.157068 Transcript_48463/m.157068 type:complete len:343 (-) Transcript_48463:529-1557(-)
MKRTTRAGGHRAFPLGGLLFNTCTPTSSSSLQRAKAPHAPSEPRIREMDIRRPRPRAGECLAASRLRSAPLRSRGIRRRSLPPACTWLVAFCGFSPGTDGGTRRRRKRITHLYPSTAAFSTAAPRRFAAAPPPRQQPPIAQCSCSNGFSMPTPSALTPSYGAWRLRSFARTPRRRTAPIPTAPTRARAHHGGASTSRRGLRTHASPRPRKARVARRRARWRWRRWPRSAPASISGACAAHLARCRTSCVCPRRSTPPRPPRSASWGPRSAARRGAPSGMAVAERVAAALAPATPALISETATASRSCTRRSSLSFRSSLRASGAWRSRLMRMRRGGGWTRTG